MARTVEARLRELESVVGEALVAEDRRCLSFSQIVRAGEHLAKLRRANPDAPQPSAEEWDAFLGPPELVLADGESSPTELIADIVRQKRAGVSETIVEGDRG